MLDIKELVEDCGRSLILIINVERWSFSSLDRAPAILRLSKVKLINMCRAVTTVADGGMWWWCLACLLMSVRTRTESRDDAMWNDRNHTMINAWLWLPLGVVLRPPRWADKKVSGSIYQIESNTNPWLASSLMVISIGWAGLINRISHGLCEHTKPDFL